MLDKENGFGSRGMMILAATGKNRFLNLEEGKTYPAKPADSPIGYLEKDTRGHWRFVIENIYNYPTEREEGIKLWQTMSAEEIAQPAGLAAVPFERRGTYELRQSEMPKTILIPQWGLLQIEGVDDRTESVIVQYKRVAGAGAKNEGAADERLKPRRASGGEESREYAIRKGETLARVATVNGVTPEALRRGNPNVDWKRLQVGQKVTIPSTDHKH